MPFEIPQPTVEAPAKVGKFQEFADAILRGCEAFPLQAKGVLQLGRAACAMGALYEGCDFNYNAEKLTAMAQAYIRRYGAAIAVDNDDNGFTREQIAARIAAL